MSPYFHATFKGQFKEAADRRISLVDTTAATFRIFLQWAHAQLYSSGRLVDLPDLSILPCTTQPTEEAGASSDGSRIDAHDEDGEDNDYETSSDTSSNASYGHTQEKAFDEEGYQSLGTSHSEREEQYFKDEKWVDHYNMYVMSFLNLYIFADAYSVHQLRDDIMTAMLGQTHAWNWWPDITSELLSKEYANLPHSAKFHQFMIDSAASYWLADPDPDLASRLRQLHEWQPQFAFEVSLTQAKALQALRTGDLDTIRAHYASSFSNSCSLHEHITYDQNACRERIKKKAHVFTTLIEACAQDGISMIKERENKHCQADIPD